VRKRILVVDDDTMSLVRTRRILERTYDVLLADSGEQALDKLKSEPVDLILLDIEMPKMSGLKTFERMKEYPVDAPVIFLTASGDVGDVVSAIQMGAVNYLKKPFLPQELLKRVAKEFEKE
jgi:DNA-binding response OmpR family regulator